MAGENKWLLAQLLGRKVIYDNDDEEDE